MSDRSHRTDPESSPPTHAGGVVVREDTDGPRFLVARSSDGRHWVLPKGHIESGETPAAAALREVHEETGVTGRIVRRLGLDAWRTPSGEAARGVYFLMRFAAAGPAREERALRWLDAEAARRAISFAGSRAILEAAIAAAGTLERDEPNEDA